MTNLEMDVKIALWMGTHRIVDRGSYAHLFYGDNAVGFKGRRGWQPYVSWPFLSGYLDYIREAEQVVNERDLRFEYVHALLQIVSGVLPAERPMRPMHDGRWLASSWELFVLATASAMDKATALCRIIDGE